MSERLTRLRTYGGQRKEVDPELARTLPQYLTREQAAQLACVTVASIDRWRRLWVSTEGRRGIKTYRQRVALAERGEGDVRISKQELLAALDFKS
jgi:hypothetical protein